MCCVHCGRWHGAGLPILLLALALCGGCDSSPKEPQAGNSAVSRSIAEDSQNQKTAPPTAPSTAAKPAVDPKTERKATPQSAASDKLKPPPLFEGWDRPTVAFVLTGQQMGYIEPCGCTGLANQKGGLARRASLLSQLRDNKGWEVVPLDVGNQVRRYGRQPEIKFQRTVEALRSMGYAAATFGPDDLQLPADGLLSSTSPPEGNTIFTSANVALLVRDLTPSWLVVEAAGKKIGVVGVLGDSLRKKLQGEEVIHSPAAESLGSAVQELKAAGCDFHVLLAHASLDETRELAKSTKIFDLVVTGGGVGEPTLDLEPIAGTKSQMAQVGTKGMYVGVVGLFDDAALPLKYQRVPLDSSFPDAPEMLKLLADYQEQLRRDGLEGIGATEQAHPSGHKFVGTAKCVECHTKALEVWENSPHAHATDSIVRPTTGRGDIPRHYDPECLSCHVTGWEPQKYFPYASGYLSLEKSAHLKQNGCENCHGPGSAHVAAEEGEGDPTDETIARLRDQMRLPLAGGKARLKCLECHDLDNDPHFQFEDYWPQIEHIGKD